MSMKNNISPRITGTAVLHRILASPEGWLSARQITEAFAGVRCRGRLCNDGGQYAEVLAFARRLIGGGLLIESEMMARHDGETVTLTSRNPRNSRDCDERHGTEPVFHLPPNAN